MMCPSQLRALVVEDSPAWQELLAETLRDMGLDVDVAGNLAAAEASLRAAPHQLAIVDLSLRQDDESNRDGIHALDAIRRFDPGCIPFVLTGYATVELAVSVLREFNAHTCLRKEAFRRGEFREIVTRALASASAQRAGADAVRQADSNEISAGRAGQEHGRALLVEDDAGWRSILAELLVDAGFTVRTALSYGEALGLLRRERHDVAVIDLALASSTSRDANRDGLRILAETHAGRMPAIVVSGLATQNDIEQLYAEYHVFACLDKAGFERSSFKALIAEAVSVARSEACNLAGLTAREREVLALLSTGLTNKGIAHTLMISENTVKRYLKSLFAKLDVDSRASAVAKAMNAGIRPPARGQQR